jgi:dihydroorotate dehydrogenase electron transfer subunit
LPLTPRNAHAALIPVLSNREIVPGIFRMAFEAPRLAAGAKPGQFVMLSIPPTHDPLLPRPFAVFNVDGQRVEILYRRVGKGTGLLSGMRTGDLLRVLGPLGNGFALPDPSVTSIVLAGGIGFASVHFLLLKLLKRQTAPTTLLYGVRSHEEIIPMESLDKKGLLIRVATEDGQQGVKGTVIDLLSTTLPRTENLPTATIESFACGPLAMLRAVAGRMKGLGMRSQFSMESRMACGYGVCQGCVIPFKGDDDPKQIKYRKVCTEGPVFAAEEICWDAIQE